MLVTVGTTSVALLVFSFWGLHLVQQVDRERDAVAERVSALMAVGGARDAIADGRQPNFKDLVADGIDPAPVEAARRAHARGDDEELRAVLSSYEGVLRRENARLSATLGARFDRLSFLVAFSILLGGAVTGLLALGVLRERRLVVALAEAARERGRAERAEEMKDRLLANTAHELRTPLASVLGLVELGKEDPAHLDEALQHGFRLASLLQDLLDLASMQSGRSTFVTESVHVDSLLRVAVVKPLNGDGRLQAALHVGRHLELDPRRLIQIVTNLCSNALRYAPDAPVELAAAWADDQLTVVVSDRGPGFGEDAETLFQPYQQGSNANSAGLGIGLTVVQETVAHWGGRIQVTDREGGGARIEVVLPCPTALPPGLRAKITAPPWAVAEVLLVEDDPTLRMIVSRILKNAGYLVRTATSGEEGLEMLEPAPLAILLDWHLPGIDGVETGRRIRAAGVRAPLVALTARAAAEDIRVVKEAGFDAHLAKPVQPDRLLATLQDLLPDRPLSEPGA